MRSLKRAKCSYKIIDPSIIILPVHVCVCVCVSVCVCVCVCLSITAVTYTNELIRRAVVIRVVIVRSKSTAHTWRRRMGGTMKEHTQWLDVDAKHNSSSARALY